MTVEHCYSNISFFDISRVHHYHMLDTVGRFIFSSSSRILLCDTVAYIGSVARKRAPDLQYFVSRAAINPRYHNISRVSRHVI